MGALGAPERQSVIINDRWYYRCLAHVQQAGEIQIAPRVLGGVVLVAVGRQLVPQIRPGEVGAVALDQQRRALPCRRTRWPEISMVSPSITLAGPAMSARARVGRNTKTAIG